MLVFRTLCHRYALCTGETRTLSATNICYIYTSHSKCIHTTHINAYHHIYAHIHTRIYTSVYTNLAMNHFIYGLLYIVYTGFDLLLFIRAYFYVCTMYDRWDRVTTRTKCICMVQGWVILPIFTSNLHFKFAEVPSVDWNIFFSLTEISRLSSADNLWIS